MKKPKLTKASCTGSTTKISKKTNQRCYSRRSLVITWARLKTDYNYYWFTGTGLYSFFYVRPATEHEKFINKKDLLNRGVLGKDYFVSEDEVVEDFKRERESSNLPQVTSDIRNSDVAGISNAAAAASTVTSVEEVVQPIDVISTGELEGSFLPSNSSVLRTGVTSSSSDFNDEISPGLSNVSTFQEDRQMAEGTAYTEGDERLVLFCPPRTHRLQHYFGYEALFRICTSN